MKSTKLRNSAKLQECAVRLPGVCNFNPETTVLAHLNGGGMGTKHSDLHACFACSSCHAWLDKDYVKTTSKEQRDMIHTLAIVKTQQYWLKHGFIKVGDK